LDAVDISRRSRWRRAGWGRRARAGLRLPCGVACLLCRKTCCARIPHGGRRTSPHLRLALFFFHGASLHAHILRGVVHAPACLAAQRGGCAYSAQLSPHHLTHWHIPRRRCLARLLSLRAYWRASTLSRDLHGNGWCETYRRRFALVPPVASKRFKDAFVPPFVADALSLAAKVIFWFFVGCWPYLRLFRVTCSRRFGWRQAVERQVATVFSMRTVARSSLEKQGAGRTMRKRTLVCSAVAATPRRPGIYQASADGMPLT